MEQALVLNPMLQVRHTTDSGLGFRVETNLNQQPSTKKSVEIGATVNTTQEISGHGFRRQYSRDYT